MEKYHPSTLDGLLDVLVAVFGQEALDDIRGCRTLGKLQCLELFIRKNLVLQNDNRSALYADCGEETPGDVAQVAILRMWERLRDDPMVRRL